ncbi:uncharacterized protein LOC9645435 [Selaginella moellendorffii]|uniref:uncharacterized protein LOC9645435 n=1 Tax=Selaginella moellendorffii TaxID=88036 RepID=UPI000D1C298A|nr:uncharacterized protein LOC9645435 [Selaginella moellendorffii]|eukprot:XP_024522184.1 uncharacterized protein LOC9645435 [Selaginella moellendorffii]
MASTTTSSRKHSASSNFRGLPVRSRSRRSFAATRVTFRVFVAFNLSCADCKKDLSNMQIKRAGKLSTRPVRKGTATSSSGLLQIAAEFHGEMHQRQESLSEPTHEAEKFIKEDVELLRMSLSKVQQLQQNVEFRSHHRASLYMKPKNLSRKTESSCEGRVPCWNCNFLSLSLSR